jgi:hypothetical protein
MPKITSQNNFSTPPSAHPYQIPSSSSDHRGRTLTQATGSAIGKPGSYGMQSQTSVQHSASQVQPIHQPVQASGTQHVTVDILNRYLKMTKGLNDNHAAARDNFIKSENLAT